MRAHALVSMLAAAVLAVASGCGARGESAAEPADCSRQEAQRVLTEGEFAELVREATGRAAGGGDPRAARLLGVECADLTADGVEEMVVRSGQGKPSAISPWAIFRSEDGEWTPALARDQVRAELTVAGGEVVETQPVYTSLDRACCPSGQRRGTVSWNGERFLFAPDEGSSERGIELTDGRVARLGSFRVDDGPRAALRAFGTPAHTVALQSSCLRDWPDLGLTIVFASFGPAAPCDGPVQTISIGGPEAEQAGWATDDGLAVGITLEALRSLHPEAARAQAGVPTPVELRGAVYVLAGERLFGGHEPVLSARVADDRVVGLEFYVGLAGE